VLDAERSLYSAEDSLIQSRVISGQGLHFAGKGARRRLGPIPVDVSSPIQSLDTNRGPRLREALK